MTAINRLTPKSVSAAKPGPKIKRLPDGAGLYLIVEALPADSKWFALRWSRTVAGKKAEGMLGLGSVQEVTLAEARAEAAELRKVIRAGGDPRAHRRVKKASAAQRDAMTFRAVGEDWMKANRAAWAANYVERNEWLLTKVLYPAIGNLPIAEITEPILLKPLREVYATRKETARRARAVAAQVFEWGKATHVCTLNPARDLARSPVLAKPEVTHHKALKPAEVGPFLRALATCKLTPSVKVALRMGLYTALRDASLRGMTWGEVNLDAGMIDVPGSRMKSGRDHRVPLAPQAVALLREHATRTNKGPASFVFPSAVADAGCIAENTLASAIRSCGFDATFHGLRATAATVLNENGFPSDVVERMQDRVMQGVRAAYTRGDYFDQRKVAAAWFADWMDAQEREDKAPAVPDMPVVRQLRLVA